MFLAFSLGGELAERFNNDVLPHVFMSLAISRQENLPSRRGRRRISHAGTGFLYHNCSADGFQKYQEGRAVGARTPIRVTILQVCWGLQVRTNPSGVKFFNV